MDAVITYVNGLDPLWQQDYAEALNVPILEKRFRDWGTLKYLLRGIEKNMPFVENVFLVVARESQVPEWVNGNVLKVVCHKDFVPSDKLPTFNSNTIELNLHRIPGLAGQYLYLNDDMFPVEPGTSDDFFPEGKAAIGFSHHLVAANSYKKITRNSDRLARKLLDLRKRLCFVRPQHTCSPMLRNVCEEVYAKAESELMESMTKVRTSENFTQYLFLDYALYSGRAINRRITARFVSINTAMPEKVAAKILSPRAKLLCINDGIVRDSMFEAYKAAITGAFETKFPDKSRFEL